MSQNTDRPGRPDREDLSSTVLEPAPKEDELLFKYRLMWAERKKRRDARPDLHAFVAGKNGGEQTTIVRLMKQVDDRAG